MKLKGETVSGTQKSFFDHFSTTNLSILFLYYPDKSGYYTAKMQRGALAKRMSPFAKAGGALKSFLSSKLSNYEILLNFRYNFQLYMLRLLYFEGINMIIINSLQISN